MRTDNYDVIVIGAGHNGLVCAAYLARAGKRVLVLERRPVVGGSVVTEEFADGFKADAVWAGGTLRPDIVRDLKLAARGPKPDPAKPALISLLPDSANLTLDPDPAKAAESIRRFSATDAARWPEFVAFMNKAARFLDSAYSTLMPRLPKNFSLGEGYGLAELALDLRLAGRRDMLEIIRMLPMTAAEFLDEWFESGVLKAALASVAIHGVTLGPMSAGTTFNFLHQWLIRGGLAHVDVGLAGELTQALAEVVRAYGGGIRTEADVKRIIINNSRATGVALAGGEEIAAAQVISAADPKHTLLTLVGPMELPPEFVWKAQSIKMRGSVAKVHLLLDYVGAGSRSIPAQSGRPLWSPLQGTFVIAPTLNYLERAYDAAKYGEISEKPYLEVTSAPVRESAKERRAEPVEASVVSIHFQFAPYTLKQGTWNLKRETLENLAIDTLTEHFPNLKSSIVNRKSLTPLDLEQTYGLTEGDLNHGQLMLDQFLFMRPLPGWSNHKTPVDHLYLCGSGVHAGGGVSGASGRNAARVVLNHSKRNDG